MAYLIQVKSWIVKNQAYDEQFIVMVKMPHVIPSLPVAGRLHTSSLLKTGINAESRAG